MYQDMSALFCGGSIAQSCYAPKQPITAECERISMTQWLSVSFERQEQVPEKTSRCEHNSC